jgi:hypothetical protein
MMISRGAKHRPISIKPLCAFRRVRRGSLLHLFLDDMRIMAPALRAVLPILGPQIHSTDISTGPTFEKHGPLIDDEDLPFQIYQWGRRITDIALRTGLRIALDFAFP